jgi:excisionase family DNA binding protein
MVERLLYQFREAAERLSLCERSVWQLVRDGKIRSVKIGKSHRIAAADLDEYVEQLRSQSGRDAGKV